MARAARDFRVCWGRQLLPALPDFGPEHPNSRLRDTSCPPIITEHFATTGGGSGAVPAGSAGWLSSALAEQPSGELLAAHGAALRPGTCARVSPMPWAHLPQKKARWGERAGRRRRPRSRQALSAGCRPLLGASCSQRCQISVLSTQTAVCATPVAPPSSLSTLRPFGSGSLGAHADSAPCTVQRVGRAAAGRAPCLAWSRRAPWYTC